MSHRRVKGFQSQRSLHKGTKDDIIRISEKDAMELLKFDKIKIFWVFARLPEEQQLFAASLVLAMSTAKPTAKAPIGRGKASVYDAEDRDIK